MQCDRPYPDVEKADGVVVDFYDRGRIATWLRDHEGLIPWVRTLAGRSIRGWQSYGSWAYSSGVNSPDYLVDDRLRLRSATLKHLQGLTAVQGIQHLRHLLSKPRAIVRLVGLSGVGKTRLVQALFDERVGEGSLPPSIAVYTDMSDQPDPSPIAMASDLVMRKTREVLVIDNCPPDLHSRLSEVCSHDESRVSLITVEYDVQDDESEGTDVFKLESSSPELVERLVVQRYPQVSKVDASTIADFSGGNARIGLALAASASKYGTLAGLTDKQLFQRLFRQRQPNDNSLYLIAQACALVYSFEGTDVSNGRTAELVRLGRLISKSPQEMYLGVAELKRRGLVQERGKWRAVLPHAIANRLAATALQNFTFQDIEREIVSGGERLLRSFSRRLGYLHASDEATTIVRDWFAPSGLLANPASLNDLGQAMFTNIAPAAPPEALAALERAILGPNRYTAAEQCRVYRGLLHSLAYDPGLFTRAATLLVSIVGAVDMKPRNHTDEAFVSLFHLILSGTKATIEQRTAFAESLICSPDEKHRALGVVALNALLEALQFQAFGSFDFGAQSRDFGYWPERPDDARHWFTIAVGTVEKYACAETPGAASVRAALAERFRGLWLRSGIQDEIVDLCEGIRGHCFWPEGWIAVRETLDIDGTGLEPESHVKLVKLEKLLRPSELAQQVRAVVFSNRTRGVNLGDFEDHSTEDAVVRMQNTEALAKELGQTVAGQPAILNELLPEMVTCDGQLWMFGEGLAAGAPDPRHAWGQLVTSFANTPEAARKPQVLRGFLHRLSIIQPDLASSLFDEAVQHETLGPIYPFLQAAVVQLSNRDVSRLRRSVSLGRAPANIYSILSGGRATDPIPPAELKELLLAIATLPGGQDAAIDILDMRLSSENDRKVEPSPELIETGCVLLEGLVFAKTNPRRDRRLGRIATACLIGERGASVVFYLGQRLREAAANYHVLAYEYDDLIIGLLSVQPLAALDALCAGSKKEIETGLRVLREASIHRNSLQVVSDEDLLNWCDQDAKVRYPAAARVIEFMQCPPGKTEPRWSSIGLQFLERAPDPSSILAIFVSNLVPASGWTGSRAATIERNAALLDHLKTYPALENAVTDAKERVRCWVAEERKQEALWDREQDERFE